MRTCDKVPGWVAVVFVPVRATWAQVCQLLALPVHVRLEAFGVVNVQANTFAVRLQVSISQHRSKQRLSHLARILPSVLPSTAFGRTVGGVHRYQLVLDSDCSLQTQYDLRSEPSSRAALMGEQPNPWDRLQPQDATSRHRGAKPCRRYELLGKISLLSPG